MCSSTIRWIFATKGTGGIDIGISSLFQLVIDRSTDAVGTDHHAFVRLEICDAVHNACSAAGEIVHHGSDCG